MKDAFNFWFSGLKEKFSNPVIFTVMWVFVLWNWKHFAILIFDVDQKVATRIEAFANTDLALWQPLVLTGILVLSTPFLNTIPNVIKDWAEVFYCWLKKWQFGVQMVSPEVHGNVKEALNEALIQRNDSRDRVHELEKQIAGYESLSKELSETEQQCKTLQLDKDELTNKLNDVTIKLSESAEKLSKNSEEISEFGAKNSINMEFRKKCRKTNKLLRKKLEKLETQFNSMDNINIKGLKQSISSIEDLLNDTFGDPNILSLDEVFELDESRYFDPKEYYHSNSNGLSDEFKKAASFAKAHTLTGTVGDAVRNAHAMLPPESKLPHLGIAGETMKLAKQAMIDREELNRIVNRPIYKGFQQIKEQDNDKKTD